MPAQHLDVEATVEREQVQDHMLQEEEEQHAAEELGYMLIGKRDRFPAAMRACAEATGKMFVHGLDETAKTSAAGRPSTHHDETITGVGCLFIERGKLGPLVFLSLPCASFFSSLYLGTLATHAFFRNLSMYISNE